MWGFEVVRRCHGSRMTFLKDSTADILEYSRSDSGTLSGILPPRILPNCYHGDLLKVQKVFLSRSLCWISFPIVLFLLILLVSYFRLSWGVSEADATAT